MTKPNLPTAKSLVVCADDYGMTPEVSAGILQLARSGCISATSVMSLSASWPEAAKPLKEVRAQLDVGLHLDFTSHLAMAHGMGASLPAVMLMTLLKLWGQGAIERHIEAQLDLFETHFQAVPDHVDGHQHVQQFPVIRDALMAVLVRRYGHAKRPWLRISRVAKADTDLKSRVIGAMGANALEALAEQHGFSHSKHLTGVYDFHGDAQRYWHHLGHWLQQVPDQAVLMCHPARGLNPEAPYPEARLWEQEVFESQRWQALLQQAQVEVVRGSDFFRRQRPELAV
jgi:predicted glycoside hydrolase/deacetylase ChbG (UPF0249 family)